MRRWPLLVLTALLLAAVYLTADQPLVRIAVLLLFGCGVLGILGGWLVRRAPQVAGGIIVVLAVGVGISGVTLLATQHPVLTRTYTPDALTNAPELVTVRGFYTIQQDTNGTRYAWTQSRATLLLDSLPHKPITVTIEIRSAAIAGGPDVPVSVVVNNETVGELHPDPHNPDFQTLHMRFTPYDWGGGQTEIKLLTTAFQPPKGDNRQLGTMVKSVTIDKSEAWGAYQRWSWVLWLLPFLALIGVASLAAARRSGSHALRWGAVAAGAAGTTVAVILLMLTWYVGLITPSQFRAGILGSTLLVLVFALATLWLLFTHPAVRAWGVPMDVTRLTTGIRARLAQIRARMPDTQLHEHAKRSIGIDLTWVFLIALAVRILWVLLVPPWLAPDEPDHYTYTAHVAEQGIPHPPLAPYNDYPLEFNNSANLTLVPNLSPAFSGRPRGLPYFPVFHDYTQAQEYVGSPTDRLSSLGARATPYPALYFVLASIPYHIAYAAPVLTRLFAVRLASAVLGALSCLFGYLFAYELRGTRRWGWALGLGMAFQPMFAFSNATVNNDAGVFLFCTMLVWLIARLWNHDDIPIWNMVAIGAVIGLIVITKPTGFGVVLATAVLVGIRVFIVALRDLRHPKNGTALSRRFQLSSLSFLVNALGRPIVAIFGCGVAFAIATAPWIWFTWRYWGSPSLYGAKSPTESAASAAPAITYSLASYARAEVHRGGDYFYTLLIRSFWGVFGWLDEPMPDRVYVPIAIFCVIGMIGFALQIVLQPSRRAGSLLALTLVLGHVAFVFFGAEYYQVWRSTGHELGLQGRYFLPILAPILFVWFSGWEYLLSDHPIALRLAPIAMLAVQLVGVGTLLAGYYGVTFG